MIAIPFLSKRHPSFQGGVHPDPQKELTEHKPIEFLPVPQELIVPVQQHLGRPGKNVLNHNKTPLIAGELIAEPQGVVSAAIHTPVSGSSGLCSHVTLPNGIHVEAVAVQSNAENLQGRALFDELLGGEWPKSDFERFVRREEIPELVRKAGIVGQGGATFPTAVKLTPNPQKPCDLLLLNGAECEPYLTADHRLMIEAPDAIVCGALIAALSAGCKRIVLGIEDNKPEALHSMQRACSGTPIEIVQVRAKYPQGGEKHLIRVIFHRVVPTCALPLDVGVVVLNVATAAMVAAAVIRKKPLTHRVMTVSGHGVVTPKNVFAPVGVSHRRLIDFCGGLTPDAARVISGGPMMGFAVGDLDSPVTKGTSGITVLTKSDLLHQRQTACIRCGRCIEVCPLHLMPQKIGLAARNRAWDLAQSFQAQACIECGCCAYSCPAALPLVQLIRLAKAALRARSTK